MIEKEFTIIEPKKSIFIKIVLALILATYTTIVYYFLNKEDFTNYIIKLLLLTLVVFNWMVIPYLSRKSIHLNFSHKKIKYEQRIGPISIKKKWKTLKNLKYISVFSTENGYEVNLWHSKNKIINLFVDEDIEAVVEKAFFFAEKLEIDLLDARERGYHRWINKTIYRQTNKIEYID
ncbi:hypothetical protein BTO05_07740 [Winogradskyella sp. PC-19]|uniref:hypothetical protein n=1 Tax=unclassified Winogradskyella TaxID=2615021 RepID=UPI000B3C88E5|nr:MULTISPECIES: hypothetical protein [unclassified Winogradskyella]ARV09537.1 hypothetical protein BTO05_07740 [Winogradskyella sp. PC-19]RZN83731.1 MAG: hypothetical protein EVB12_01235 [Winogradskyella sp.]